MLERTDVIVPTPSSPSSSASGMALSGKREMVQMLVCEPILDYLVQNGVLTKEDALEILNEMDTTVQNVMLLKLVDAGPNGQKLFTNVLRQTGQHYLANLADDGARIKALSGSGLEYVPHLCSLISFNHKDD